MKDFIYSEKFDNYLKGKLSQEEKLALEDKVQQDPLLRNELKLQKEIFNSLGDARKAYLKSRLDQVPVNTVAWYNFSGIQWAAVISSVFFLAGGTYFYTTQQNNTTVSEFIPERSIDISGQVGENQIALESPKPVLSVPEYKEEKPDDTSLTASSQPMLDNTATSQKLAEVESEAGTSNFEKTVALPQIVRPDVVSTFTEDTQQINYEDFEAPDKSLMQAPERLASEVEIENVVDSKYNFHYQLFNNRLYLHGDFEGNPYKIIALNKEESKTLFLEYNGGFYNLKLEQKEIAPLKIIKDSTMIKALTKIRTQY
ncbi:hypothetical protein PZB74_14895 [Porifericola rhodea]|uniref:hypothetical protein n=1 Tax=Porifericola rhodea TaxID=930972 RepID=UPI002665373D|nr:hypothetical protein [Porifericola rhodea]WKN30251.1 hypothetical protein PZB74_14895 [Porifericola rhodea]